MTSQGLRPPSERVILITGASDGIGLQTAIQIAAMGSTVILHGRSQAKLESARDKVAKSKPDARLETVLGDLSSLKNTRELAQEIQERFPRLDVLLNNAGVYMKKRELSVDGYEMTFHVNHLAPFLLTNLLLPTLKHDFEGRVVTVSSMAHARGEIDWENLQAEKQFDGYGTYSLSKLCNVLFSNELSHRLEGTTVTSNSLHPGVINTKLLRTGFGAGGDPLETGAKTTVFVSTSEKLNGVSGRYFSSAREGSPSRDSQNRDFQKRLWDVSMKLVGLNS